MDDRWRIGRAVDHVLGWRSQLPGARSRSGSFGRGQWRRGGAQQCGDGWCAFCAHRRSGPGGEAGAGDGAAGGSGEPTTGPCASNECANGSLCVADGAEAYTCDCTGTGFSGALCDVEVDECDPNPCNNDAVCSDLVADFACACPAQYAGKDCSLLAFELLPTAFAVRDLSADGRVLVGTSNNKAAAYADGKLRSLGVYVGDTQSAANAVSADGEVIVGISEHVANATRRAVIWTENTIVELDAPATHPKCSASSVTPDGVTIAGSCTDAANDTSIVVRWIDRELEELGTPSGTSRCYEPVVSGDGETVFAACSVTSYQQPMRWTAEDGAVLLVAPEQHCRMQAVVPDGRVGAGFCSPGGNSARGFEWTDADGFEIMSGAWLLKANDPITTAHDISEDGTFIVGNTGNLGDGVRPVRWNADRQPVLLTELLSAKGVTLTGWSLWDVSEVSANGQVLVGQGTFEMSTRGWIARLE